MVVAKKSWSRDGGTLERGRKRGVLYISGTLASSQVYVPTSLLSDLQIEIESEEKVAEQVRFDPWEKYMQTIRQRILPWKTNIVQDMLDCTLDFFYFLLRIYLSLVMYFKS